ncbi:nitrate reductase subunit alpha [Dongshaea marina]|uniref:nitrate reductase subunit alpha n=1 Tax=Dongshaea marina TaxID=2047966 RepID=UPI002D784DD8|nr:nitrate reductase subunit alpha [Dongshaea marina]
MSYFLDRLNFFKKNESFANGYGLTTDENRRWEDGYRQRWQHDKIVRSTHGVNCTGSCSWKIYVKNGIITWETQQTDYPRTRPDLPNHEPRGCARGASYSWYLYSANRQKYPLVRGRLIKAWRQAITLYPDPVDAWASIQDNQTLRQSIQQIRGHGGFVRSTWDEVNTIIAAANIYTIKSYGPDRIIGFSPIPAMSMISYAAGSRYLSLIGGTCMSFYDWYCDLPPSSPQTWGEQTDVPESADWYNSSYLIVWGSNVPQTRTPDAHFLTEVRYKGAQAVVITPDYSEASKFADIWLAPKQGTDAALAMAMGHVILKEFYIDKQVDYFEEYARQFTDLPMLVLLKEQDEHLCSDRFLRASDLIDDLEQQNNPEWKTICFDEQSGELIAPQGSIGFRWGEEGRWNLEPREGAKGEAIQPRLTNIGAYDEILDISFPYFGGIEHEHFANNPQQEIIKHKVPVRAITTKQGTLYVATVFDLMVAHYGVDRGLDSQSQASSYEDNAPYTPAWQEKITGVPKEQIIQVARGFADNAAKTQGKSMVIVGAAMNHWYHMDMNYRGLINMLMLCGCTGQSGGGWAHYVGQEKLRPQTGWQPIAFGLDWARPPRQMNSTSFFYAHTDQWRYEHLKPQELLSPLADNSSWQGSIIDSNIRAERMGWLPSAPQLQENPLKIAKQAKEEDPLAYTVNQLKSGKLSMSCEDPDHPNNWPRNLFVWRSNLLGSSGKGHEYFLKHLLGTEHGVQGEDLGAEGAKLNQEAKWHGEAPRGKLDLLVTLDFRMSTTALYSDIVLPSASWYEKNDLNTSDMHPFIHPLSKAVDPVWESRSDWEIYKGLAKRFSELVPGHLGVEQDLVLTPILHDTPGELAQPTEVKQWKSGDCEPIPGKTMPAMKLVERDYPNVYQRFTSLGPLMETIGNGGKGIAWDTKSEVEMLKKLHGTDDSRERAKMETDIQACDTVMSLAPETNGEVALRAWKALSKVTGRDHSKLAEGKEEEKIRFRDIQAQPRKIISSPTWSGLESEHVSYTSNYTNVHELIPWRTLTGRQQFYQDHPWLRDFGEGFTTYKPPISAGSLTSLLDKHGHETPCITLNFITPHQKWGIHSTYSDNLHMLTLSRGAPSSGSVKRTPKRWASRITTG